MTYNKRIPEQTSKPTPSAGAVGRRRSGIGVARRRAMTRMAAKAELRQFGIDTNPDIYSRAAVVPERRRVATMRPMFSAIRS